MMMESLKRILFFEIMIRLFLNVNFTRVLDEIEYEKYNSHLYN